MRLTITLFSVFWISALFAQDYNYIHYDPKDGLPSSTVYCIIQDSKGYVWFGTDNGVSRFDGKNFTNFTTDDGLTDNEVLNIYADSKGRVWMMPFNKSLCYYYNGKIYNHTDDTALKKVNFSSYISPIGENKNGDVYFLSDDNLFCYSTKGTLEIKADFRQMAAQYSVKKEDFFAMTIYPPPNLKIAIYNRKYVFIDNGNGFVLYQTLKNEVTKGGILFPSGQNYEPAYPVFAVFKNYNSLSTFKNNNSTIINTSRGSWVVDSAGKILSAPFLPGKKVSHAISDNEGNLWFSTLGEGVYRLTAGSMKTFAAGTEAFSLEKAGSFLYAGLSDGRMEIIRDLQVKKEYLPASFPQQSNSRRLYTMKSDGAKTIYLGYDSHLEKWENGSVLSSPLRPVKALDLINENSIAVCTNFFVYSVRTSDLKIMDTLLYERGTKILYDKGTYYIGTLNGLVIIDSTGKKIKTADLSPLLANRIVDIRKASDGSIWLATNDKGVIQYKNGQIKAVINFKTGLSSNGCKALCLKDQYLWVGTNKGINKIDTATKKVVARYSTSDGLASNNINALLVDDSLVWVASPGGVTFFNEHNISDSSICALDFHTILVSGKKADTTQKLQLGYRDNNITFEYTAISFKSAGEIIYKYKLEGLDHDWKETNLTTLSYPSLPPGKYTFQLYAINKFGKKSQLTAMPFTITAPFWKTIWFWLLISLTLLWLTTWLISRRYRIIQQRTREKNELKSKVTELEQASLRAQMNPHFIFNCLNSIQHYIIKNDIEQTNKYITRFGSLIRQTLDNSAKTNITIADEVRYLTDYMELEKMRFPAAFNYSISIDPGIQADYTYIPGMVLQPFIENAIRHGIRNKEKGTGLVSITIKEDNEGLYFCVEDNGVGREAAARLKSQQHIEYQSKGITLATNRLELLSEGKEKKIMTTIIDLKDEAGNPSGTKVIIFFPHKVVEKLN